MLASHLSNAVPGLAWLVLAAPAFAALLLAAGFAQAAGSDRPALQADRPAKAHPRLFLPAGGEDAVLHRIEASPLLQAAWTSIQRQADEMLALDPVERRQVGRRLLDVSRTAVKRVSYLALAYRLTGEAKYLDRAEAEMLAAADFEDWNPSHFLDVAEMTAALAIGYDWLYADLGEQSRATIRQAIIDKGITPSFAHDHGWITTTNNWSQVCHGGLTMGALAILDHEPELAERVINRALANIHRPMDVYGPRGAYPEGPGYWAYGTSFNILLIDALVTALGDDFGLLEHQRFMASPEYFLHVHGPTLRPFNYSDNADRPALAPAMFWFARQLDRPELLWHERRKLANLVNDAPAAGGAGNRLLALLLVWAPDLTQIPEPRTLHYKDEGEAPVGLHRSGWDETATFVGVKAGKPRTNHGQMDIGSFVMDAHGVRWAIDLGGQDYHSLERLGLRLWNMAQDSDRWSVFRLNNHSKNTLVVDGRLQRVDGFASITSFSDEPGRAHTIQNMAEVYEGQLAAADRGVRLGEDGDVLIQDELTAPDRRVEVRWAMITRAEVQIVDERHALLRQDGKQLGLHVVEPADARLEIFESANPPAEHDAPNPGTRMIGFKVALEPGQHRRFMVQLNPGGAADEPIVAQPLAAW